jgi:acetyl esterase/lipase
MSHRSIIYVAVFAMTSSIGLPLPAVELPSEVPLWEKGSPELAVQRDVKEQVRSLKPQSSSPSGLNRAFSSVSSPSYSIHCSRNPNGVGLVICPGDGFRDVWLDRECHDLAIWLKDHDVTCLVLKYRTFVASDKSPANTWPNALRAAEADARQAVRVLRKQAASLQLDPNKIGVCGFSAGGQLALKGALCDEPKLSRGQVSGMPDFAGLFYPGIPEDVDQLMESRIVAKDGKPGICPIFIVNARDDPLTPADKCVSFYAKLLKAGVKAELHVFSKGSHGFDLGAGRGESAAIWPTSFSAWLSDCGMIQDKQHQRRSTGGER